MEQIKRANRLYTNDSIYLKKSLSIPVLSNLDDSSNAVDLSEDSKEGSADNASAHNGHTGSSSEKAQQDGRERASDLTPVDFLKRLDDLISQSKQAAVRGCQDGEQRVAALEAACSSRTSDWRPITRSQSVISSSTIHEQGTHVAVPLTVTKLTKKLRDKEDEIFEL